MGIKFKGSKIAGKIPNISEIDKTELALNTKDWKIFTPANTIGISEMQTRYNISIEKRNNIW